MSVAKPVIGIPADRRIYEGHPFHQVGEKYIRAITDCVAGIPLQIPVLADLLEIDELLSICDGILFTGSPSDIEPHHYDGEPSAPDTLHDPHRDALTLPLARQALEQAIPVFAICRGFQEFNVVAGGSLHQDITAVPGFHWHDRYSEFPDETIPEKYGPAHDISLSEGGMLESLLGQSSWTVNSLHRQGVNQLGEGLTVEAIADDGIVEAFRFDDAKGFNLAVQWHPEWKATEDKLSVAMFKAFGDACRERAAKRRVSCE
ncbi:MAG: gamma-glutamyl-gamma-aminobutyrate hydrolase family protein [Pseudomonadota bacterium]